MALVICCFDTNNLGKSILQYQKCVDTNKSTLTYLIDAKTPIYNQSLQQGHKKVIYRNQTIIHQS